MKRFRVAVPISLPHTQSMRRLFRRTLLRALLQCVVFVCLFVCFLNHLFYVPALCTKAVVTGIFPFLYGTLIAMARRAFVPRQLHVMFLLATMGR